MPRYSHHRLPTWQRFTLYTAGVMLVVSGIAWIVVHYSRAADALPSPAEPWAMRLHGLAGFAALFVFGALAASHVPLGWRLSQRLRWASQRGTGLALSVLAVSLSLTGYLLYYFAPEGIRPALGWLHSGLGLSAVLLVAVHRNRRSRPAHSQAKPSLFD